ncbi:amino acid adenylation domain-containing protein [Streptomyces sp. NPDC001858]
MTGAAAVDAARAAFARACGPAQESATAGLWVEDLPFASTDARALRLREREALRGAYGDRPRLRAVLLTYADDTADLVAVAHHGLLDRPALRRLVHALAGQLAEDSAVMAVLRQPATDWGPASPQPRPQPPDWAMPGDGGPAAGAPPQAEPSRAAPQPGDPAVVTAAAALVLSRHAGAATVRLAVPSRPGPDAATGGVLTVRVDERLTAAEFVEQVRQEFRRAAEQDDAPTPAVGLVLTEPQPDERYHPFLAPPFPLTLVWECSGEEVAPAGAAVADPRIVDPGHAVRFQECVCHVVSSLHRADPHLTLADIALVDPLQASALRDLGRTEAPHRDAVPVPTLHEAVHRLACSQPHRVAVSGADGTLTYGELDARATSWAHALRERGAVHGGFVGVCMERGTDLVVALLAVLKTGAAYVPLDVHHPGERLRCTTEDAGLPLVVTTLPEFPAPDGSSVVRPAELDASAAAAGPLPETTADDPAYVIYTSGTTGRPKGVVVPHRNVLALLNATRPTMGFGPDDVWTLFHSTAFDFSVWEIWGCLLTGGRLVVVPYLTTRSPADFHELLVREQVTVLNQTPSAFSGLLDADGRQELAVRLVVFGGEALDPRMLRPWFRRYPTTVCRVVNMYGITETTVHVTAHEVTPVEAQTGSARVGRALPGWSVSVRDERGRLVPVGAIGEIYVGGAGVAREYLGREQLTAERFPVDPATGERLYRSGDRGRMRPDGSLDHLGRLDDQVKLRGFRIEPGEVRSVLMADPAVREAAVVLDEHEDPAYTRLVGYVVLRDGSAAEVRRRVGSVLPEHMVPSVLVELARLPLTVNGKLDRTRLPVPERTAAAGPADCGRSREGAPDRAGTADAAGTAGSVLAAWRAALADDAVGPDDDFFEAGGNSLIAVRLLTALREKGLPSLSPRDLYVHRTAARLAALADTRGTRS